MRGSLRERQPGVWQVRVCAGRSPVDGESRYVTRTVRGGKREAQRIAAELVAEVERGLAPLVRGTVAQLLPSEMSSRAASTASSRSARRSVKLRRPVKARQLPSGSLRASPRGHPRKPRRLRSPGDR